METPLESTRDLGSAREGAHHWWVERLTSVSTLLLFVWFAVSLIRLPGLGYGAVTEWLSSTVNATGMLLLVLSSFWHLKLGLQVIVEDYVHEEANKFLLLMLLNLCSVAGAVLGLFAIVKIALGGAAD
jgi:succinate dehydrogenase / fumarate reductase, membrane anchor subunit